MNHCLRAALNKPGCTNTPPPQVSACLYNDATFSRRWNQFNLIPTWRYSQSVHREAQAGSYCSHPYFSKIWSPLNTMCRNMFCDAPFVTKPFLCFFLLAVCSLFSKVGQWSFWDTSGWCKWLFSQSLCLQLTLPGSKVCRCPLQEKRCTNQKFPSGHFAV